MTTKIPVRINYNGENPDGLAEFQDGETIDPTFLSPSPSKQNWTCGTGGDFANIVEAFTYFNDNPKANLLFPDPEGEYISVINLEVLADADASLTEDLRISDLEYGLYISYVGNISAVFLDLNGYSLKFVNCAYINTRVSGEVPLGFFFGYVDFDNTTAYIADITFGFCDVGISKSRVTLSDFLSVEFGDIWISDSIVSLEYQNMEVEPAISGLYGYENSIIKVNNQSYGEDSFTVNIYEMEIESTDIYIIGDTSIGGISASENSHISYELESGEQGLEITNSLYLNSGSTMSPKDSENFNISYEGAEINIPLDVWTEELCYFGTGAEGGGSTGVITTTVTKTVGLGQDFSTFHDAMVWVEQQQTRGAGLIEIILPDTNTLPNHSYVSAKDHYYSIDCKLSITNSSEGNGLITHGDTSNMVAGYKYVFKVSGNGHLNFSNITIDPTAGGYSGNKNLCGVYVDPKGLLTGDYSHFKNMAIGVKGDTQLNFGSFVNCINGFITNVGEFNNATFKSITFTNNNTAVGPSTGGIVRVVLTTCTFNTNGTDTNIPIAQVQPNGSYISDNFTVLSFAGGGD